MASRLIKLARRAKAMSVLVIATVVTRVIGGRNASPFVLFPRSPIGEGVGDAVPFDPDAPPCAHSTPEPRQWARVNVPNRSQHYDALSLRMPPEFIPHFPEAEDPPGDHWERLIASWYQPSPSTSADADYSSQVAFWIGPTAGFPTVGMPPGTKQLSYRECRGMTSGTPLRIAAFVLREPHQHEIFYSAAVWEVSDGIWLRALASGPAPESHAEAHAIFSSVTVSR